MAIVDMKKLTLVAYGKDKHALLKTLEKTGVVEVQRSELIENTFNKENLDRRDEITSATLRLQFVFDFLKTEYAGGRHQRRLDEIAAIEDKNFK